MQVGFSAAYFLNDRTDVCEVATRVREDLQGHGIMWLMKEEKNKFLQHIARKPYHDISTGVYNPKYHSPPDGSIYKGDNPRRLIRSWVRNKRPCAI